MEIKADEITEILKQQLAGYEKAIDVAEVGTVLSVGDGIARVYGLDNAMAGELLDFGHDLFGLALNLEEDNVGVVLLGESREVSEGQEVRRTGKIIQVPVGPAMVGRVVDALGRPIDGKGPITAADHYPIERTAPGVVDRQPVREPVQTGLKAIDAMIPIGRGQRELVIGDRQTGKTAVALDTIINQKGKGLICIYVAIGQKKSTAAQVVDVSAYMPTNVISITDGQIYLESDLFYSGVRPAVNVGLSVSRVGGNAQIKAMKQVAGTLRIDLAQYRELAAFAQFGSDLDKATQSQLARGRRLVEILKQPQFQPMAVELQIVSIFAGTRGFLDSLRVESVLPFEAALHEFMRKDHADVLSAIVNTGKLEKATDEALTSVIGAFKERFVKENAEAVAA